MTETEIKHKCLCKSRLYFLNAINSFSGLRTPMVLRQVRQKLNMELSKLNKPTVPITIKNYLNQPDTLSLKDLSDEMINDFSEEIYNSKLCHPSELIEEPSPVINKTERKYRVENDYLTLKEFLQTDYRHRETYTKQEIIDAVSKKLNRPFMFQYTSWKTERILKDGTTYPAIIGVTETRGTYSNPFYQKETV